MSEVTLYSIDNCPYCDRAKDLLQRRGIGFQEIKIERSDHEAREKLLERSGMKTFPQIFHGSELIGGFSDLSEKDKADQLSSLR